MLCCHGITIPTELKLYCVLGVTKTLRIDVVDKILSKLLYFHCDYHHFCSTVAQYNSPWAAEQVQQTWNNGIYVLASFVLFHSQKSQAPLLQVRLLASWGQVRFGL